MLIGDPSLIALHVGHVGLLQWLAFLKVFIGERFKTSNTSRTNLKLSRTNYCLTRVTSEKNCCWSCVMYLKATRVTRNRDLRESFAQATPSFQGLLGTHNVSRNKFAPKEIWMHRSRDQWTKSRAGAGLEPAISRLWAWRDYQLLYPAKRVNPTAGSPTVTLLRLDSSHQASYHEIGCLGFSINYIRERYLFYTKKLFTLSHFQLTQFPECDGRWVQGSGTDSPWRADPRLLVIPPSCSRVAESNLN